MKRVTELNIILIVYLILTILFLPLPVESQESQFNITSNHLTINLDKDSGRNWRMNMQIEPLQNLSSFQMTFNADLKNLTAIINNREIALHRIDSDKTTQVEFTPLSEIKTGELTNLTIAANLHEQLQQVEENKFQFHYDWGYSVQSNLNLSVILPQFSRISNENSIFPNNNNFQSNGNSIIVNWLDLHNNPDLNSQLFIQFEQGNIQNNNPTQQNSEGSNLTIIFILSFAIILISILTGFGYYYYSNKVNKLTQKVKTLEKDDSREERETRVIKTLKPVVLSPQEREVLKIIEDAGDNVPQSDLPEILDLTKARVSQLLSNFEDKGIIKKVKLGRKNYINLNENVQID